MKFTERFFKFPIRYIDEYGIAKLQEEITETKKLPEDQPNIASVNSIYKLPYGEVDGWQEINPPETKFEDIAGGKKEGLQCTMVYTKTHGDLLCSWNVKKFEEKLDEYHEKMTEFFQSLKKVDSNSITPEKGS